MTTYVVSDTGGWVPLGTSGLPSSGVTAGTYGDSSHVAAITVNAQGQVTAASSVAISGGGGGGGGEIGYDQITSSVNIVSTTEATGTTVISCAAHTFDGGAVIAEFFSGLVVPPAAASGYLAVSLFEGSTQITELAWLRQDATNTGIQYAPLYARYRFTPTAASHTYKVTAFVSSTAGTPSIGAGSGGTGGQAPAFIRFTSA